MKRYEFTLVYVSWDGRIVPHKSPGDLISDWAELYAAGWHNPSAIGTEDGYTKYLLEREIEPDNRGEEPR